MGPSTICFVRSSETVVGSVLDNICRLLMEIVCPYHGTKSRRDAFFAMFPCEHLPFDCFLMLVLEFSWICPAVLQRAAD